MCRLAADMLPMLEIESVNVSFPNCYLVLTFNYYTSWRSSTKDKYSSLGLKHIFSGIYCSPFCTSVICFRCSLFCLIAILCLSLIVPIVKLCLSLISWLWFRLYSLFFSIFILIFIPSFFLIVIPCLSFILYFS